MPNPIQIMLSPEHEKFVEAEVRSRRFASADQVVAEALSRLMQDPEEEIDDVAYAALRRPTKSSSRLRRSRTFNRSTPTPPQILPTTRRGWRSASGAERSR